MPRDRCWLCRHHLRDKRHDHSDIGSKRQLEALPGLEGIDANEQIRLCNACHYALERGSVDTLWLAVQVRTTICLVQLKGIAEGVDGFVFVACRPVSRRSL